MPKAILELEMPESCNECKLTAWNTFGDCMMCSPLKTKCPEKGKRSDCPLKLVEGKEVEP